MTEYTELQIMKHALKYYMMRPDAEKKDIEREQHLLDNIDSRVALLKEEYRIG
ncbi:hypothetical protein [Sporolactobacillus shoreae]|uniref:hypothetical protein n=1 Tax=Sporolactobacillus shoreae TaxID=1465501 RepID=UPI001432891A|nr:hypothetical protein [Sporolactobacillus shoreae]